MATNGFFVRTNPHYMRNIVTTIVILLLIVILCPLGTVTLLRPTLIGPQGPAGESITGLKGDTGPAGKDADPTVLLQDPAFKALVDEAVATQLAQATATQPVPTAMSTAQSTAQSAASGAGTLASDQPTNVNGYQASPIGGLTSTLPILCETWGPTADGNKGFVVTIPTGSIAWFQKHFGGTCWWVNPADLEAAVQRSVTNVTNRDGVAPVVVRLPADTFPLLGCLQTIPVDNGIRHCDKVGGFPAYDAPAKLPDPGLFPGYGK